MPLSAEEGTAVDCKICQVLGRPCRVHAGDQTPRRSGWKITRIPIKGHDPDGFLDRLAEAIIALVPLAMFEQGDLTDGQLMARAQGYADILATRGDALQYADGRKFKRKGELAVLAHAFACLARSEGGLSYLGVHVCTAPHDGCPATW